MCAPAWPGSTGFATVRLWPDSCCPQPINRGLLHLGKASSSYSLSLSPFPDLLGVADRGRNGGGRSAATADRVGAVVGDDPKLLEDVDQVPVERRRVRGGAHPGQVPDTK